MNQLDQTVLSLSQQEKENLKELALASIRRAFEPSTELPEPSSEKLKRPFGVFITLRLEGSLRGCIGDIAADRPLWESVQEMAEHAAFKDPRFPPLTSEELGALDIEISVLSSLEECPEPGKIVPGRDGLAVQRGMHSGLLLPQVAREHGWDRETYLKEICLKAGLPPDCWRSRKATLYWFQAEVF